MRSVLPVALFAALLLFYLAAGVLYATLTPPWQAPDEPAHYNYIHYLATQQRFPELVAACYDQAYLNELTSRRFPPELSIAAVCYEFHQPPFYYLMARPIFWWTRGDITALRLFSVGLGAGVVVLAFLIGRTLFPRREIIAYGTMAFVAFVPMHLAMLASINNDAMAELILAALLFLLIRRLGRVGPVSMKENLVLGLLLGLGLITKVTVYIAVPVVAVALWLAEGQQSNWWPGLLKKLAVIYGVALGVALPWYIRNATLYGGLDILGLGRHDAVVVGQLRTGDYLAKVGWLAYLGDFIATTFRSFWGQFGWMAVPMDSRTYFFLTVLSLIALVGLGLFLARSLTRQPAPADVDLPREALSIYQRYGLSLMALIIGLMLLAYGWYNLTFVQFQGRYLFPALIPLGVFFSLGLAEAMSRRWAWWLSGVMLLALVWIITTSAQTGGVDKWATLITGLSLLFLLGWAGLGSRWARSLGLWLVAACYLALAFLALAAPFWFVLPHLSH